MATLTGFKPMKGAASNQQQHQNQQNGGLPNPVFVFDEVPDKTSEDSQDESHTPPQQHKQAHAQVQAKEQEQQVTKTAPRVASHQHPQVTQSNSPEQFTMGQNMQQTSQLVHDHGANANATANMSVLSIDCQGDGLSLGGKSPKSPRRSPLMALFRGKPRESTRRTYSDEDQFEIEWADLSLEVEKKNNIFKRISACFEGSSDEDEWATAKKSGPRTILNGVDGRIRSGEITAVLGPSGAGKTSLLNSLFGKYRTQVTGSIKVTGAPSKKHLTVCTIPQSDYLIGQLTTEEALWFASRLKNCEDDFQHDKNIERVIELLGLQRCRKTRINKLSGGQYKRVSIAQEMLSSPDILVLDEPTSGLDSLTCYRTVKVLRDLVEASKAHNLVNPMSIVLTIHQPHKEVLDLFHSVYVMAVGGYTLYHGPPNEMEEVINAQSGVGMPAQGYNPASFMVEVASEEYGKESIEKLVSYQRRRFLTTTQHSYPHLQVSDKNSGQKETSLSVSKLQLAGVSPAVARKMGGKNFAGHINPALTADSKFVDVDLNSATSLNFYEVSKSLSYSASNVNQHKSIDSRIMTPRSGKNSDGVFFRHVSLMARRCLLSNMRDPLLFTIRVGAHIFIPLVVALIYGPKMGIPNGCPFYKPEINLLEYASVGVEEIEAKHDDIRVQFQNVGLHFMVYYAFGLCVLAFTAISFPLIMHVLIKEIRNGWYSLGVFIMGKTIAELPMAIVLPPISVGIIYVMTGQPSSYLEWRYLVQSMILILIVMIAEAKGLIFGAVFMNSMQTSVFAASVSTVPFILLSGFLIRIREIPYVLQHFAHLSYFKHSVEALIITRYGFHMCECDEALIPPGGIPRIVGIPPQVMSLTDYYITSYQVNSDEENKAKELENPYDESNIVGNNRSVSRITRATQELPEEAEMRTNSSRAISSRLPTTKKPRLTTLATEEPATETSIEKANTDSNDTEPASEEDSEENPKKKSQGVFFNKLAQLLTRANAFGFSIKSCDDVEPFTIKDMKLKNSQLPWLMLQLLLFIIGMKIISYLIVDFCIKFKL